MKKNSQSRNSGYMYYRHRDGLLGEQVFRNAKEKYDIKGYKFIVIYFELLEMSLKHDGCIKVLVAEGSSDYILNLSRAIGEDSTDVREAVAYFIERGMIKILERADATLLHLPGVQNMIGKSSKKADRQRLIDRKRKNLSVDSDNTKKSYLGRYRNIYIESDKLDYLVGIYGEETINKAIDTASEAKANGFGSDLSDYSILRFVLRSGGKL